MSYDVIPITKDDPSGRNPVFPPLPNPVPADSSVVVFLFLRTSEALEATNLRKNGRVAVHVELGQNPRRSTAGDTIVLSL